VAHGFAGGVVIKLTPFKEENIDTLTSWVSNAEEVMLWAGPAYKIETLKQNIFDNLNYSEKHPDYMRMFSAINSKTNEIIGHVQIALDKPNETAGIARMIVAPEHRGKGYSKTIIHELLKYGFNDLNLNIFTLVVFDFNLAAIKCYERCGFVKEGILRDRRKVGNEYWSLIPMSMKKGEYIKEIEIGNY
jgi:RimJ/RimL family protein N-acetyltransferase